MRDDIADLITCAKFCDNRFRDCGFWCLQFCHSLL